jgi:hypothetical protein
MRVNCPANLILPEECRLLGYKIPGRTSQETQCVSVKSPEGYCYVRFEVFMAVTMKNALFWDIKTQFIPHKKHYVSATEPSRLMPYKIWSVHGSDYDECRLLRCDAVWLLLEPTLVFLHSVLTANVDPSWLILFTLMMVATRFSEMSVPTRTILRHIPEDGILYSHSRENLKSHPPWFNVIAFSPVLNKTLSLYPWRSDISQGSLRVLEHAVIMQLVQLRQSRCSTEPDRCVSVHPVCFVLCAFPHSAV